MSHATDEKDVYFEDADTKFKVRYGNRVTNFKNKTPLKIYRILFKYTMYNIRG